MGSKLFKAFQPVKEEIYNMYEKCLLNEQAIFYLCQLIELNENAKVVDSFVSAYGMTGMINSLLNVCRREFHKPANIEDINDPIPIIRVFDYRENFGKIGKALDDLSKICNEVRGYCVIQIMNSNDVIVDEAFYAKGEQNILDKMPPLIEELLQNPENIEGINFVRW